MDSGMTDEASSTDTQLNGPSNALPASGNAPEWIELVPAGEFHGRDGRGPFRLSEPGRVIAATNNLRMEAGIPIDYDHATDFAAPEGRPAPAAGWITELTARDGALWGRVEWTTHGAAAVATREYRYVSAVFEHDGKGEVARLLRAALTNNPNLYLTAISARKGEMDNASGDSDGEDEKMARFHEQLREVIGLEPVATPEEIIAAVRELSEGATTAKRGVESQTAAEAHSSGVDPARFVSVAHFQQTVSELNELRAARARERAENAVGDALRMGKLVPAQREWAIAYCQADFDGFQKFIARQPAVALGEIGVAGRMVREGIRAAGEQSIAVAGSEVLTAAEVAVCAALGIQRADFARRKNSREDFLRLN
jgi:phage I-like protein